MCIRDSHKSVGTHLAGGRRDVHAVVAAHRGLETGAQPQLTAPGHDVVGKGLADPWVVDNPRARHVQGLHAVRVGLDLCLLYTSRCV